MRTSFPLTIEVLEARIAPASFVWDGSTSTDWFTPSNWTPDGVPGSSDTATLNINSTINLSGAAEVAIFKLGAGTLSSSANATFSVSQNFDWTGGTILGGSLNLGTGGTHALAPFRTGTLEGVTLTGDLTLSNGATATVRSGLTLANGAKLILDSAPNGATIQFTGTQTLAGLGEIILGGTNSSNNITARGGGTALTAAVLTIGPGISVHGSQGGSIGGVFAFDGVTNQGTILADTAAKTITIDGSPLINEGTISATAGTVNLGGNWNNATGRLDLSGTGILNFGGNFTTASIGMLTRAGGTINVTGMLDNFGATLALNAATGSFQLVNGTIKNGTITGTDGAGIVLPTFTTGTLEGVSLGADLPLGNGATLSIRNGLTLVGGARLLLGSAPNGATVQFLGTQTLDGTGEVVFGGTNSTNNLLARGGGSAANAAMLTIGPGITVHGPQGGHIGGSFSFDGVINQGTIVSETAGKTISIDGAPFTNQGTIAATLGTLTLGGNWSNPTGHIDLSNSGVVNLAGNFNTAGIGTINRIGGTINLTGILDNSGATLALSAATGSFQLSGGTIQNGTITGADGAGLILQPFASGTLEGVTLASDIPLRNGAILSVRNGLTLSGGSRVILGSDPNGSTIQFLGTQTLGGNGEIVFAGTNSSNNVNARGGGSAANAAQLTIGAGITIHGMQGGSVGGTFAPDGVINQGTIVADTATKIISLDGAPFVNQGTISASAGTVTIGGTWSNPTGHFDLSGSGVLNFAGNFTTTGIGSLNRAGGTVNITGTLDNTDATLALNAATGSFQLISGTIKNGTVTGANGSGLLLPVFTAGTLEGVTLAADFTVRNGANLSVRSGLTLAGGARLLLNSDPNGATVQFVGTQTLGGIGEVIFGGTNSSNNFTARGGGSAVNAAVLTIGSGITIHGPQGGSVGGTFAPDGVINQGTITADTAGKIISVDGAPLLNQGTIAAPVGTVTLGGNWNNTGTLDLSGAGVFNFGGNFTTAGIGLLNRTGGTVNITGTLDNSGATLALNAGTGSFQLVNGTIKNGTVSGAGGAGIILPVFTTGTLEAVTLATDFAVGNGAVLAVQGGLTLAGGSRLLLDSTTSSARVQFLGTQTLAGTGEVVFSGASNNDSLEVRGGGSAANAAVLTIGPGITVRGSQSGFIRGVFTVDGIINQGTIIAETSGETITIDGSPLINQGTISAPAGTITLRGDWSNPTGSFIVSGAGVLNFAGDFTTAGIGTINRSGGTVNITGILDNSNSTLALNAATGPYQLVNGTIKNGTVTAADVSLFIVPGFSAGTIDGVTLATDLLVSNGSSLSVRNGLTLSGGHSIMLDSGPSSATLQFFGTQTLAGIGEVIFGGTTGGNVLDARGGGSAANAAVLTIGPGITVRGTQAGFLRGTFAPDSIINQGTILSETPNKTVTISAAFNNQGTVSSSDGAIVLNGNWVNTSGTFELSGAGRFDFGGTFTTASLGTIHRTGGTINVTGTLDNSNATLALNAGTGSFQLTAGVIKNGTITAVDGTGLIVPAFSSGTLDGVTLAADISLSGGSSLSVHNGLTLSNGAKVILNSSSGASLQFVGTQTLGGSGQVIFGGTAGGNTLYVRGGGSAANAAVLTIGSGITVHGMQGGVIGGLFAGDEIINQGTIIAETAGQTVAINNLTQTSGGLRLAGGTFASGTGITLAGGELTGSGTFNGAVDNPGGVVRPGGSTGTLTISGDYTQSGNGTLFVEIGGVTPGAQYDQLRVIGTATLGGTLSIDLIGDFIPASTDVFDVVTATTRTGSFDLIDLPPTLGANYTGSTAQIVGGTLGIPIIRINDVSIIEADDTTVNAVFTITLSEPSLQAVTVLYETGIGTASVGTDYVGLSPILLTFNPGETSKTVAVDVLGDNEIEGSETFFIDLRTPTNAVIGDAQGIGTIIDDDAPIVISPSGKSATLTDIDGDTITIKTTKGALTAANFVFGADGSIQKIDLLTNASFSGANLVISAEAIGGGNGLVDVGAIDATNLDLSKVIVTGTLGQIIVGDGDGKKSALKSLTIGSLGTDDPVSEPLVSEFHGAVSKLNITADVRGAAVTVQGNLKKVTVGGDLVGDTGNGAALLAVLSSGGSIVAAAGTGGIPVGAFTAGSVGSFNVKGNMNGGSVGADGDIGSVNVGNDFNGGAIAAGGHVQVVKVFGKLKSDDPTAPTVVAALARLGSTKAAGSVAIDRLEIRGDVENAQILLGYKKEDLNGQTVYNGKNPDASSGKVVIGGDWVASSLVAGVFDATADGFGQNDQLIEGDVTDRIVSRIASVVIKGNATGSATAGDHFGIVAQEVGKLSIAGDKIALNKDAKDDILLDEANGDFRILEV